MYCYVDWDGGPMSCMHITVFGATGRTGVPLVEQALAGGHDVTAFVRDRSALAIDHDALAVVEGDAYTGEGVERAVADADAVCSVLGQTRSGPDDLQTVAGRHILTAMAAAGVERFVTLTGAGVRDDDEQVTLSGKAMGLALKLFAKSVLEDARTHIADVRESDTDWTVVRGPRLTEGEHTGEYRHGALSLGMQAKISRADVADFVLQVVEDGSYVHEMPLVSY